MYYKNNLFTAGCCMLFCLCFLTGTLRAQEGVEQLEVYKIAFTTTGKAPSGKNRGAAMTVYNHHDYLYATQTGSDQKKTSWLLWYKAERLLKIEGKTGLPLNYRAQLKTNVYLPGEAIDSVKSAAGTTGHTGDWDNENEYNMPGYGTLSFTRDTLSISGYLCRKAVIQFHYDAQGTEGLIRGIEIWYSPGLPSFFLPPFSFLQKIPGAALSISIEDMNGEKVTLRAYTVIKQYKDLSFFKPAKDIHIFYPPQTERPAE